MFTLFTSILNGKPTKSILDEPKRCCLPELFSAQISASSGIKLSDGTTVGTYGYYNISYDISRGRIGMKGVLFSIADQQKSNLWIIENINEGQIYTLDQDSKTCYKSRNPIKAYQCIPDSATYIHSSTYGYGSKQIIADTWFVEISNAINYITVSRDGHCVPLTGHNFLSEPPLVNTITTTDFQLKIDDSSIFDIPSECGNVA